MQRQLTLPVPDAEEQLERAQQTLLQLTLPLLQLTLPLSDAEEQLERAQQTLLQLTLPLLQFQHAFEMPPLPMYSHKQHCLLLAMQKLLELR